MPGIHRILIVAAVLNIATLAAAQDAIPWAANVEQAKAIAAQQNKVVLIHFWSDHCPPCRRLEQEVFNKPHVGNAVAAKCVPVKVNTIENPQLAKQYGIRSIPHDVFITPDGKVVWRGTSPQGEQTYVGMVQRVAATANLVSNSGQAAGPPGPAPGGAQLASYPPQNAAPPTSGGGDFVGNQQPKDRSQFIVNQQFNPGTSPRQPAGGNFGPPPRSNPGNNTGSFQPGPPPAQNGAPANGPGPQPSNPYFNGSPYPGNPPPAGQPNNTFAPPSNPGPPAGNQFAPQGPPPQQPRQAQTPPRPQQDFQAGPPPAAPVKEAFPLAMDGYCPVTLLETKDPRKAWKKGDVRWGAHHRGRTYLFAGADQQKKFLANPDYFSPALSCYDPVQFAEANRLIEGKRAHGLTFHGQVFLFSDEASLQKFSQAPQKYSNIVRQAMRANANGTRSR